MKKKLNSNSRLKTILYVSLFLFFGLHTAQSQTSSGIFITWNVEVGCQNFSQGEPPKDEREPTLIENILDGQCIRVCRSSSVTYTLSGLGSNPATQWSVAGGTITNQTTTNCTVTWSNAIGTGSLSFTVNTPNGPISKTICIERIIIPTSNFMVVPTSGKLGTVYACMGQTLNFTNLSVVNNGTALVSYEWNFGDGSPVSSVFEPTHIYTAEGTYTVTLKVTNACNCSHIRTKQVVIKGAGFDISCPTVMCQGQSSTYTLPKAGIELCAGNYNWEAIGGTINSQSNGQVNVTWNQVDATGFGYLIFNTSGCALDCLTPTTIKVPVVQTTGTIQGNTKICAGQQAIYKLPQWPSTDFTWSIDSNQNGNLAHVILSDQRNEVIIEPLIGTGTLTLRAKYQNTLLHCGGTAVFTITIVKPSQFEGPLTLCKGNTGTYTLSAGPVSTWILKNSAGNTVTSLANSSTFSYNFATAGNYSLSLGSGSLCFSEEKTITVLETPTAPTTVNGEIIICPDAPYTYSIAAPEPNFQYRWEVTNGTPVGSAIGDQFTATFTTATTHQIKVYKESISPLVCSSLAKTIDITNKQINAAILGSDTVCANNQATYKAVKSGTDTLYTEGETYSWSITPPHLGSVIAGQGTNSITILWNHLTVATNATVTLTIKKCTITKSDSQTVTITPVPAISITAPASACSGSAVTFTINPSQTLPTTTPVNWNFNGTPVVGSLSQPYTFSNIIGANVGQTITATITNPNGCPGTSNTAIQTITITPAPPASLSFVNGNAFCPSTQIITTILNAATTGGSTIKWYKNGVLVLGVTGTTYAPAAFGSYYFTSTNSALCTTQSNTVNIQEYCPGPGCVVSPSPIITPTMANNCGTLVFSATATPAPLSASWSIIGPNTELENYTGASYAVTAAGQYFVAYNGLYTCSDGTQKYVRRGKNITVPYLPNFAYTATCSGNNTFAVKLIDKTSWFNTVTNPTYNYSYKLVSLPNIPANWTSSITTANGTMATALAAGTYNIKLVVKGKIGGEWQPVCEKIDTLTLTTLPNTLTIINNAINCHDTSVNFAVNGLPGIATDYNYLWTLETIGTNTAQSTLATPTRVYTSSGSKKVSVTITNKFGCFKILSKTIIIPAACFTGTLAGSPNPPIVCAGSPVTLTYTPGAGNCPVANYTWMEGQTPVNPPSNTSSITVNTPGFYWLKVKSANNCLYETPNRITPQFKNPPSIKLLAPAVTCKNNAVEVKAITNGTAITWVLDSVAQPLYNGQLSLVLNGLSVGSHTLAVISTLNGCSDTATQTLTIVDPPTTPVVSYTVLSCNPYKVQLTATATGTGTYNWNNGMSGATITVTDGGPYQVRYTLGGCSVTAQLDVAKNPEKFIWIFPSGCMSLCPELNGSLIGPRLPLLEWQWLRNNTVMANGGSITDPYTPNVSGAYNLTITPDNPNGTDCSVTSPALNLNVPECLPCAFSRAMVKNIITNSTPFCSYTVQVNIFNTGSAMPISLLAPNNEVVIQPATTNVTSGSGNYTFTLIPINGFNGGVITLLISGITPKGEPCTFTFQSTLPACASSFRMTLAESPSFEEKSLRLVPNPARDWVTVYTQADAAATLAVYDLTGRLIAKHQNTTPNESWQLDAAHLPKGLYIVVLSEKEQIKVQQKLIIE